MLNLFTKKKDNKILPRLIYALSTISILFVYTYCLGNNNNKEYIKYNNLVLDSTQSLNKIEDLKENINDVRFYLYNFKYKDSEDYYSLFNKYDIYFKDNLIKLKVLSNKDKVQINDIEKAYDNWLKGIKTTNEEYLFQKVKDKLILIQSKENDYIKLARTNRNKSSTELYKDLKYTLVLSMLVIIGSYLIILKELNKSSNLDQSLEDNQTVFNKFMDASSNIAWIKTKESKIIYINRKFKEVFGSKALNKIDYEWLPHSVAVVNIKNDLDALTNIESTDLIETVPDLENNNRVWLVNKFSVELLNDIFIGGTATDITRIIEAEKLLESKNNELRVSNEEIQQFIYIASHDLQEPIRMVHNYVELLEKYLKSLNITDERLDKYTKFITSGSKRMKVLVDDVLQYSRAGNKDINYEIINVNNIISNILVLLSSTVEQTDAVIEVDTFPNIVGNYSQIEQVFTNLISNATKFVSKTSPLIKITYTDDEAYHLFKVIDNGIGIDEQYFTIIFDVFKRLHKKEDYPGTGIGLAICKKIIKKHGGDIWVESILGIGTTFCFTIPKKDDYENIFD